MGADFNAIFSPSEKPLAELVQSSSEILYESGLTFQNAVWQLRSVNGQPGITAHAPVPVERVEDVVDLTKRWWGRSLEWFSSKVGEVFFKIYQAEDERHILVYNEGRRIHRMRDEDDEMRAALLSMLLRMVAAFECEICTYRAESPEGIRPPSLEDVQDAIRLGERWDGDIAIVAEQSLSPQLRSSLERLRPGVKRTTSGACVISFLGVRHSS